MRLKELRQKQNLSQTEIAKILQISQKSISNYEKNLTDPDIKTLKKIADYFGVTLDYLCEHETKQETLTETEKELLNVVRTLNFEDTKEVIGYAKGFKDKNLTIEEKINKLLKEYENK